MRRAFTLAELVVALTLGGVAFTAFALVVAQQERAHARLAQRIRARSQAIEGAAPLVTDLRAIVPAAGDIAPGSARDSAIDLRAVVATLAVCELSERTIVTTATSLLSAPKPADTAWAYVEVDSTHIWIALAVTNVAAAAAADSAACQTGAAAVGAGTPERRRHRYAIELAQPPPVSVNAGTPLRFTRRTRYSLYRAPDGGWYLGRRELSATLGRFETTQPVSGPYRAYAPVPAGSSGLELRYFDKTGSELPSGMLETHRIAKIALTTRAPTTPTEGLAHGRRDVTSITVALGGQE
jgi:prepilin-type N-terminal cleavage/methylation domain-containing protein